jgi:hypothetical protein
MGASSFLEDDVGFEIGNKPCGMEMEQLFGLALGIASPLKITGVKFSRSEGEFRGLVEISIDFDRGGAIS